MKYLDLTLPSPAENLACDEALLDWFEAEGAGEGLLRLWEARQLFVVAGYANDVPREIDLEACRKLHIPVLRRCTGGGTVLQGPGCLNYALLLKIEGPLEGITETNQFVMERHAIALAPFLPSPISVEGHTDLAMLNQKFSGNAQRRRRRFLLFHGTFLLHFDIKVMEKVLLFPGRQPPYRQHRSHADFLTRLDIPVEKLKSLLQNAWQAFEPLAAWPQAGTARLVTDKYSKPEWNLQRIG